MLRNLFIATLFIILSSISSHGIEVNDIKLITEFPIFNQETIINYNEDFFVFKKSPKYKNIIFLLANEAKLKTPEIFDFLYNNYKICPKK